MKTNKAIQSIQERFSLAHIAFWRGMDTLEICTEEWQNIHNTDRQLLHLVLKSFLGKEKGIEFAEVPIYMTHTFLLSDDDYEDYNPCGVRPIRYCMLNFEEFDLQAGVLVDDISTRIDLLHLSLQNSELMKLLTKNNSEIADNTPPYCVRWTFTSSLDESIREFTDA